MPVLSDFAQRKKIKYFIEKIPKDKSILEIGSGSIRLQFVASK